MKFLKNKQKTLNVNILKTQVIEFVQPKFQIHYLNF